MVRRTGRAVVACLAACAVSVTACGRDDTSSAPTPPAPTPAATARTAPVPDATAGPRAGPQPDHVVIVMLENQDEHDVVREAPYLASLAAAGASLTDMHAETHPSQPNYLALFSGDTQGVDDDACPLTFGGANLAAELTAAGYSFAGYSEDLPHAGYAGCTAGDYARRHSPWIAFRDVPPHASQPLSAMPTDPAALPTVSFVIPNLCHDMHDCPIADGDTWLRDTLDGYAQWARTHNSLLVVSFDESESKSDRDNHIATLAVGQGVPAGPITERTDHYRLLRTIEDLYGLPALGHSAQTTAISGLWRRG